MGVSGYRPGAHPYLSDAQLFSGVLHTSGQLSYASRIDFAT